MTKEERNIMGSYYLCNSEKETKKLGVMVGRTELTSFLIRRRINESM